MRSLLREFIIIALLTCAGMAYSFVSERAPLPWAIPEVGPGEIQLIDARALDVIWIDARSESDFSEAHIPNALLLNDENWDDGLFDLMGTWLEQPRPMVVYCSDAGCGKSKKIAEQLREALPDAEVYSLKGGWAAWQK